MVKLSFHSVLSAHSENPYIDKEQLPPRPDFSFDTILQAGNTSKYD